MPKKSMADARAISRRRRPILHTCAASILGVIDTAYKRSQQLNGPLGKLTKRVATFGSSAFTFASTIQHLGLSILSFTDDHILFLERIAESVFPLSGCVFDKIDMVVYSVEEIPRRFDDALDTFPTLMHQIPLLDWVVMYLIWWLNFLISILTNWGSRNAKEKEIVIDMSCDPPCKTPIESAEKTDSSGENLCQIPENNEESGSSEKTAEIELPNTGEEDEQVLPQLEDQMNTNDNALSLSPAESFKSAQFEYITSPSAAGESFHETKSFENVELPSIHENENKEMVLPLSCVNEEYDEMSVDSPAEGAEKEEVIPSPADADFPGKNKSVGEKADGKDKKKNTDKGKDELQILELLEAKWHL